MVVAVCVCVGGDSLGAQNMSIACLREHTICPPTHPRACPPPRPPTTHLGAVRGVGRDLKAAAVQVQQLAALRVLHSGKHGG